MMMIRRDQIISPFVPTPTPTRVAASYFQEAQAYFDSGKLDDPSNATPGPNVPKINDAIDAYQAALAEDPNNASAWAELARIQTYSSNMLRNDTERLARLDEAKASAIKRLSWRRMTARCGRSGLSCWTGTLSTLWWGPSSDRIC